MNTFTSNQFSFLQLLATSSNLFFFCIITPLLTSVNVSLFLQPTYMYTKYIYIYIIYIFYIYILYIYIYVYIYFIYLFNCTLNNISIGRECLCTKTLTQTADRGIRNKLTNN